MMEVLDKAYAMTTNQSPQKIMQQTKFKNYTRQMDHIYNQIKVSKKDSTLSREEDSAEIHKSLQDRNASIMSNDKFVIAEVVDSDNEYQNSSVDKPTIAL